MPRNVTIRLVEARGQRSDRWPSQTRMQTKYSRKKVSTWTFVVEKHHNKWIKAPTLIGFYSYFKVYFVLRQCDQANTKGLACKVTAHCCSSPVSEPEILCCCQKTLQSRNMRCDTMHLVSFFLFDLNRKTVRMFWFGCRDYDWSLCVKLNALAQLCKLSCDKFSMASVEIPHELGMKTIQAAFVFQMTSTLLIYSFPVHFQH